MALGLSVALVPLNSTMLAVALPAIGRDISVSSGALTQWLVTSYLLVGIVLQSPAGKLGDGLGHARALTIGQIIFTLGSVTGFFARSLPPLVVARCLMAAGGAVMVPSAMAVVRTRLPIELRPSAFGAFGAVMGLAAAVGPLIGGELASRMGWSWLFVVNAPPIAIAALLSLGTPSSTASKLPKFDLLGALLLGAGLTLLVAASRAKSHALVLAGLGLLSLVGFVLWERRTPEPVVDLKLFSLRPFTAGVLLVGLQNLAMYALLFELPIVLSRVLGKTSKDTGRLLLALTLAMVVCSLLGGRVARRIGERTTALLGSSLALLGMTLSGVLPLGRMAPALVLLGGGLGLTTPSSQAASMNAVPKEKSGMAAGVSATVRYLGGVAGVAIVAVLVDSGDLAARHRLGTLVFGAALLLAMFCAAAIPRVDSAQTPPA